MGPLKNSMFWALLKNAHLLDLNHLIASIGNCLYNGVLVGFACFIGTLTFTTLMIDRNCLTEGCQLFCDHGGAHGAGYPFDFHVHGFGFFWRRYA